MLMLREHCRPSFMVAAPEDFGNEHADIRDDLRQKIVAALLDQAANISGDLAAILPFSGEDALSPDYCRRVGSLMVRLLAAAIRDGRVDARSGLVTDLQAALLERSIPIERL